LSYQILPNADCPVPHLFSLKSSVNEVGTVAFAFAFVLLTFVFAVMLALRFSLRTFAFELLLFVDRLASAISMTMSPTPIMTTAVSPPSIHQIAFDFFRGGAATGAGTHCCCGGGGGGDGVGVVRRGVAVTGGSGR